jgi:hypothetical protein
LTSQTTFFESETEKYSGCGRVFLVPIITYVESNRFYIHFFVNLIMGQLTKHLLIIFKFYIMFYFYEFSQSGTQNIFLLPPDSIACFVFLFGASSIQIENIVLQK